MNGYYFMKLAIGTAQFGMSYGISNTGQQVLADQIKLILEYAISQGVCVIDTAYAYGSAETTLGNHSELLSSVDIITKIPALCARDKNCSVNSWIGYILQKSLERLKRKSVYGLLAHCAKDFLDEYGKEFYNALLSLKEQGFIKKIGFSAYTREDIENVLDRFKIDLIQVPINVFDQRLLKDNFLKNVQNSGVEIHARSVFLQGLLLMPPSALLSEFRSIVPLLNKFEQYCFQKSMTRLQVALQFVMNMTYVDRCVVGVTSVKELSELMSLAHENYSVPNDISMFSIDDEKILNPALWSRA